MVLDDREAVAIDAKLKHADHAQELLVRYLIERARRS